jgi:hypothetical protein
MPSARPLALAAAVLAAALLASASADDKPAPLKFAWPVPSKVTVTEKVSRVGHTGSLRYTASLRSTDDGRAFRLHLADFEFVEFDGKAVTGMTTDDPVMAQQLAGTLAMAKATPDLVVGADGTVKDVIGLDQAIATSIDELTKMADERTKAQLPAIRAQLTSPEAKDRVRQEATKQWMLWVGDWAGREIPEGRGVEGSYPIACPDATEVAAPTLWRRVPAESEGPGLVRLTRETTLDGEDAKRPFDEFLAKAEAATGQTIPATGMRLVDRVAVVTDPATLRPTWVRHEKQRILHMKDAVDRNDIERHEYQFDWAAAEKQKTEAEKPGDEKK